MGNLDSFFTTSQDIETGEVVSFDGGDSYSVLINGILHTAISSLSIPIGNLVLITKQKDKRYVLNSITSLGKKRAIKVVHRNG